MRFSDGALRLGASSDHALSRCLAPGYPSVRRTGVKLCSVWLLHQQAEPHVVVNIQFAADEAEFDRKLGWFIGQQKLHEYVRGDLRQATTKKRFQADSPTTSRASSTP